MASPTPTPNATINAATQGTVVFVQGEAYLRDRQGKLIAIKPGDAVVEGQEIVTAAGAVVELQLPSGARLSIGADRQVLLNDELFATATPDPSENIVSSLGADADRVIQALNAGRDPFADLEEPAAGLTAGANGDQTHDFVRLVRILEDVTPLAFEYSSSTDGIDLQPISGVTAQLTTTAVQPGTNDAPAAPPTTASGAEDTLVPLTLTATDVDGTIASFTVNGLPAHGTLYLDAARTQPVLPGTPLPAGPDGRLTVYFQPDPDWNGDTRFPFAATDNNGASSPATEATLTITPVNDAPVAPPTSASGSEDALVPVTLSATDVDGSIASFTVNGLPAHGTLYLDAARTQPVTPGTPLPAGPDGRLTVYFQPDPDWNGDTRFPFAATDNNGASSPATEATLTITPVNDAPVAPPVSASGSEDALVPLTLTATDVDGTIASFTVNGLPAHGTLYLDAARTQPVLPGTPLPAGPDGRLTVYFQPDPDWNGDTRFPFAATDNTGTPSAPADATITITPVNDAPVAPPVSASGAEDALVPVTLTATDVDGSIASFTVSGLPAHGTLYLDAARTQPVPPGTPLPAGPDGRLTVYFQPDPDWNGDTRFPFAATDNAGASSPATEATLTITPVNDAPVAPPTSASGAEDALVPLTLTATDVDGTIASFTVNGLPAHGTLYLDAARTQPVTPGTPLPAGPDGRLTVYFQPDPDWNGDTRFPFAATDNTGTPSAPTEATITITPVNDAPVAPPTSASGSEDALVPVTLSATDVDGSIASFTVNGLPAHGTLYLDAARTQPVTPGTPLPAGPDGRLTVYFQPDPDWNGDTRFPFAATDNNGASSPATEATLTITPVNDAPVAPPVSASGSEDALVPLTLTATDVDGTIASFTVNGLPAHGTLYLDAARTQPVTPGTPLPAGPDGRLTVYFQPDPDWNGDTRFPFSATDNNGASSPATEATLTITPVNDAPVAPPTSASGAEDALVPLTLTATDVDGTIASFTVNGLPAHGTLYLDAARTQPVTPGTPLPAGPDGRLTVYFQPDPDWNGDTRFPFAATDNTGTPSAPTEATITITPVNDAPVAPPTSASGSEDALVPVTLSATDVDGSIASFTVNGLPAHGTLYLDAARTQPVTPGTPLPAGPDGRLTVYFQPDPDWNGDTRFPFAATDNTGTPSAPADATITITPVNDAPVAPPTSASGAEDALVPVTLTATDVDGSIASFTVNGLPAHGTLYLDAARTQPVTPGTPLPAGPDGRLTVYFQPDPDWNGDTRFPFSATDNAGASSPTTEATLTITPVNDAPVARDDHGAVTEGGTLNVLAANGLIASALNPAGKDYDVDGDKLTIVGIRTGGKTGTGLSENVDTTVVGAHGKLVVHPDGSYTYIATDTTLRAGEVVTDTFTYTVSDGKASALAELVITVTGIDVNLPPVVTATSTNVSEEGLPGGEPDTLGTIDKTNSATSSGVISISDADGGPISVTLSAPTTTLTSGGTPLSWTGDGTQTLVGSAGGVDILRITVGNDGRYTVNLLGPVDHPNTSGEDALTVDFGVKVSDGIAITPSTLSVTIEDDAPQASATTQVIEIAPTDTNLLIVLDTSGSMVFPGMTGANRLETARAALLQLFDSYDSFGEVRIRLVTFSDVATARGTGWLTVSEANAELGKLTPSGGTHYDKAIETAKTAFTTIGKLSTGQNITYFMSDGGPSPGRDLTPTKEASWKSFLETNQMTSFALGMGSGAVKSALDPVAYDGATKTDLDGQVITELNELTGALLATVVTPATGEIFSGGTTGFGADGGHIQSIIVDGVTYAPDDTLSTLVVTGGGSHATYDATSHEITVQTAKGGTLKLDFDTGRYSYTPTAANGADSFQYVLNDRDGDSAGSQVTFLTTNAGTSQSISGGAHSDIISGGSGNDIISGGAGNDTLTGGLGSDTFKWSLTDAGVAGAPAVDVVKDFNPATPASGGDVLDLRDLLVGENSSNLGNYLHFEKSGADTVLNISTTGGYAGSFNAGATDQKVVLQGVDLTTPGTDTQIIQNLLTNGKLHTD